MHLALREIARARLRFSLLVGAVGLLVFLTLFQATLLSTLLSFFSGALATQSGEVVVYSEDARRNPEGSVLPPATVDAVGAVAGVARAGPLGVDTMTARADGNELDVVLFGYALDGPGRPTRLVEGRLPRRDGEGVASDIDADRGLAVGDTVTIVGPDARYPIRIVGLSQKARFSVQPAIFVSYTTFEMATRVKNPDAIAVSPSLVLADPEPSLDPATVASRINGAVEGVEALDRASAVDSLPGVAAVNSSFTIVQSLAFVVVALVVGIFFVILTVQKASALTLLRAIGASGSELVGSLLLQVVVVMVGAAAVGGALLTAASMASSDDFPISFSPRVVVTRSAILFALALVAAVPAIRRVLRIDPVLATVPAGVDG